MTHKPEHWTEVDIDWKEVAGTGAPLALAAGWSFFEHPALGDEGTVLAVSLDFIGNNGPLVFDTHDFDIPETL